MKILGMGIPELIVILLVVVVIVAIVLAVNGSSSKAPQERSAGQVSQVPFAGASASDLKGYKELLDMGAITQDEFDATTREILGL